MATIKPKILDISLVTPIKIPNYRSTIFYIFGVVPPGEWAVWEIKDEGVWKYGQDWDNTPNAEDLFASYNGGPYETYIPDLCVYPKGTPPADRRAKEPAKPY